MEEENKEEQGDEIEALESMYPDDFDLIRGIDAQGPPCYKITLLPTDPADDEENFIGCVLEVECPPTYPSDDLPKFTIHKMNKLTDAQRQDLLPVAEQAAEENEGAPCVFMVIEAIREWLLENNEDPGDGSAFSEMMRRQRESKRAEDEAVAAAEAAALDARGDMTQEEADAARRKAEGTPVTDETFHAWNNAFMAEMETQHKTFKIKSNKAGGENDPEAFMTGKQWFERKMLQSGSMASTLDLEGSTEADAGPNDAMAESGSAKPAAVDINTAVFLDAPEDDLDLDDFSDEDE